ncbi:Uma2 family endonuclease [Pseudanabaena sp. UWO310]|uniref:Uma2 family endonuclease n=1 Tax=Pseudanabaena sp. UWO310 TaxID=2480795 RepID=UPI001CC2005A|nr:Uma2 family endonuclease [Pseudanabaena sp. UWO310]
MSLQAMIQTLTEGDREHIVRQFVTWEQFQALESAFADIDGVRLTYCEGVLEILGIKRPDEMIRTLLGALLGQYFMIKHIWFVSTGAYTQSLQGRTNFQADLSYNFDTEKEISDLCIEVVVTSGNVAKLRKYQLLEVPEVWFWEDGKISVFCLRSGDYVQSSHSLCLHDLDIEHLEQCLLMDSQLDAMLALAERYR